MLIGWVAHDGEHCSRWRSDYSGEVFDVEHAFEGSGGHLVEALVGQSAEEGVPLDEMKFENALLGALHVSTRLMNYEVGDPTNATGRTFGHAYELLYLKGDRFVYLDKVLYATILLEFGGDDAVVAGRILDPVLRYRSRDEIAVVDRCYDGDRSLFLTTAVGDPRGPAKARALEVEYGADLRLGRFGLSRYRCLFVQLFSGSYIAMPGAWAQGPSTPDKEKWILEDTTGALTVRYPPQFVNEVYRSLKRYEETGELVDPRDPDSLASS